MRPQVLAGSQSIELFINATGSVCTESLGETTLPLCRPGEKAAWQDSSAMHISIWMFLNGHDVQRASFDPWILSFRETNPLCCKNNNSWFYLHLRTKSPCLLPLSTRNAPWTQARDPESPNRTLSTWEKTLIPESLPKRKFCHFWISASKQNKKAAFLNFLLISCKSQERKILISAT